MKRPRDVADDASGGHQQQALQASASFHSSLWQSQPGGGEGENDGNNQNNNSRKIGGAGPLSARGAVLSSLLKSYKRTLTEPSQSSALPRLQGQMVQRLVTELPGRLVANEDQARARQAVLPQIPSEAEDTPMSPLLLIPASETPLREGDPTSGGARSRTKFLRSVALSLMSVPVYRSMVHHLYAATNSLLSHRHQALGPRLGFLTDLVDFSLQCGGCSLDVRGGGAGDGAGGVVFPHVPFSDAVVSAPFHPLCLQISIDHLLVKLLLPSPTPTVGTSPSPSSHYNSLLQVCTRHSMSTVFARCYLRKLHGVLFEELIVLNEAMEEKKEVQDAAANKENNDDDIDRVCLKSVATKVLLLERVLQDLQAAGSSSSGNRAEGLLDSHVTYFSPSSALAKTKAPAVRGGLGSSGGGGFGGSTSSGSNELDRLQQNQIAAQRALLRIFATSPMDHPSSDRVLSHRAVAVPILPDWDAYDALKILGRVFSEEEGCAEHLPEGTTRSVSSTKPITTSCAQDVALWYRVLDGLLVSLFRKDLETLADLSGVLLQLVRAKRESDCSSNIEKKSARNGAASTDDGGLDDLDGDDEDEDHTTGPSMFALTDGTDHEEGTQLLTALMRAMAQLHGLGDGSLTVWKIDDVKEVSIALPHFFDPPQQKKSELHECNGATPHPTVYHHVWQWLCLRCYHHMFQRALGEGGASSSGGDVDSFGNTQIARFLMTHSAEEVVLQWIPKHQLLSSSSSSSSGCSGAILGSDASWSLVSLESWFLLLAQIHRYFSRNVEHHDADMSAVGGGLAVMEPVTGRDRMMVEATLVGCLILIANRLLDGPASAGTTTCEKDGNQESQGSGIGCYHAVFQLLRCLADTTLCGGNRFVFGKRLMPDTEEMLIEGLLSALTAVPEGTAASSDPEATSAPTATTNVPKVRTVKVKVCSSRPYKALVRKVFDSWISGMIPEQKERLTLFLDS